VYSVVRDMKGDAGILPYLAMNRAAATDGRGNEEMIPDNEHKVPAGLCVDADSAGAPMDADDKMDGHEGTG
jgi:hypothetical protein